MLKGISKGVQRKQEFLAESSNHTSEEWLWDFSGKGAQKNEICFRDAKVEKVTMLNNIDGHSRTKDDSLIGNHEVGTKIACDRDGDSRSFTLHSTR